MNGWQTALDSALVIIIWSFSISLSITALVTALYSPVLFQRRLNLKKSKEIIEQNIQVVEEARFFKSNSEFQKIIDDQLAEMKKNKVEIDKQIKIIKELQKDIDRLKK